MSLKKVDIEKKNYLIHILDDPRLGQQHNGLSGEDDHFKPELDAYQAQANHEAGAGGAKFKSIFLVAPPKQLIPSSSHSNTVLDSL